ELARRREVLRLRRLFEQRAAALLAGPAEGAAAPREAFNRWLLARANSPAARGPGAEPLLGGWDPEAGALLQRELLAALEASRPAGLGDSALPAAAAACAELEREAGRAASG
ncbi:unnamed protein product, partial [Prorocentrum cordatum]